MKSKPEKVQCEVGGNCTVLRLKIDKSVINIILKTVN